MFIQGASASLASASVVEPAPLFGPKYVLVLMGLVAVWSMLFVGLIRGSGARQVVTGIPFQVILVAGATVIALPITLLIPGLYLALGYVGERMSLGVAVCVCALLGAVRPRLVERWALVAVALAFFALVYRDQRALNSREDQMENVVAQAGHGPAAHPTICAGDTSSTIRFHTTRPAYQYEAQRIRWPFFAATHTAPSARAKSLEMVTPTTGPACISTRIKGLTSAAPSRNPTSVVSRSNNCR